MAYETRVFVLDDAAARDLERRLQDGFPTAQWRSTPHARFQIKADGVVATCYSSGKLVVQGRDLDSFAARFLDSPTAAATRQKSAEHPVDDLALDRPTIGSDEAGKGDYFGPLVVAAAFVTPELAATLLEAGVRDSKALTDPRARLLAGKIEGLCDVETIALDPEAYNIQWAAAGNLNRLLADLHARAIAALLARNPDAERVIVDKFADDRLVAGALRTAKARKVDLIQVTRAERNVAVAAASIVARAAFLDGLRECSDACGTDLHKGAGPPTDASARRVAQIGGRDLLSKVAKMHFKNTSRVPGV